MADLYKEFDNARETTSTPAVSKNKGEKGISGVENLLYVGPTKEQFLGMVFSMDEIIVNKDTGVISTRPWYTTEATQAERDLYDAVAILSTAAYQKKKRRRSRIASPKD